MSQTYGSVRRYRVRRRRASSGLVRWAVEGECFDCQGWCDHWVLLPWRWPSRRSAEHQVEVWQGRQKALLEADMAARARRGAA